jgi:hypothetical protein
MLARGLEWDLTLRVGEESPEIPGGGETARSLDEGDADVG